MEQSDGGLLDCLVGVKGGPDCLALHGNTLGAKVAAGLAIALDERRFLFHHHSVFEPSHIDVVGRAAHDWGLMVTVCSLVLPAATRHPSVDASHGAAAARIFCVQSTTAFCLTASHR